MRVANLALKFLLELAAFAALAYTGAKLGSGVWAVVLAVVLPAAAIAVWGRWNAPRSAHRLAASARIPLELAVFVGGAIGLLVSRAVVWGVVDLVLVAVNAALLTTFHQWES